MTTETDWEPFITCPVCKKIDQETCDYPSKMQHDGDEGDWTCGFCGAELRLTLSVTYEWKASAVEAPAPSPLAPGAREPETKCGVPLDVHPPLHAGYRWEHGNRVCREVPDPRTCVCGHVHPEATDEHNGECESPGCPCGVSSHAPLDVWQQVNCTPCRHWVGGRCAQRRLLAGAEGCTGFAERPRAPLARAPGDET